MDFFLFSPLVSKKNKKDTQKQKCIFAPRELTTLKKI